MSGPARPMNRNSTDEAYLFGEKRNGLYAPIAFLPSMPPRPNVHDSDEDERLRNNSDSDSDFGFGFSNEEDEDAAYYYDSYDEEDDVDDESEIESIAVSQENRQHAFEGSSDSDEDFPEEEAYRVEEGEEGESNGAEVNVDQSARLEIGGDEGEALEGSSGPGDSNVAEFDRSCLPNCPICFDPWTSEGSHRVCCFPCGHVFGRSCLEKWLHRRGETTGKCPQCCRMYHQNEIINLYAPVFMVPIGSLDKQAGGKTSSHFKSSEEKSPDCARRSGFNTPSSSVDATMATDETMRKLSELEERVANLEAEISQMSGFGAHVSQLVNLMTEMGSKMAEMRNEMDEMGTLLQASKRRRLNNDADGASDPAR